MQQDNPWQTLRSRVVYSNQWMVVKEDEVIRPEGTPGFFGYLETAESVMIAALDVQQQVYLIRTYRYPVKAWAWELPGGGTDGGDGLEAAKRELAEEAGLEAATWTPLGSFNVYPGLSSAILTTFMAQNIAAIPRPPSDDSEQNQTGRYFSLPQIAELISSGQITDSATIAAIYLLEKRLSGELV